MQRAGNWLSRGREPILLRREPGGRTKWNRCCLGIPKTHALDAHCVGEVNAVEGWQRPTLEIECAGGGSDRRTRVTAQGFLRNHLMRQKQVHGFQTADLAKTIGPTGIVGRAHVGRVAVRASGSFNVQTSQGVILGIAHRHCKVMQRNDGYGYSTVDKMDVSR